MKNIRFGSLLNRMLVELLDCWQRKTPEVLNAGAAYMITMKHWKEVKSECWQKPFSSPEEEIEFFKQIKCHFTGRLAYYNILYEALASLSAEKEVARRFWQNELKRLDKFTDTHRTFVEYINRGDSQLDEKYFLRKNSRSPAPSYLAIYDGDPEFSTSCDYLVSGLFAERQYHQYVRARLDAQNF